MTRPIDPRRMLDRAARWERTCDCFFAVVIFGGLIAALFLPGGQP